MRKKGFAGVAAGRTERATQPNSVWPPARPFSNIFIHLWAGRPSATREPLVASLQTTPNRQQKQ